MNEEALKIARQAIPSDGFSIPCSEKNAVILAKAVIELSEKQKMWDEYKFVAWADALAASKELIKQLRAENDELKEALREAALILSVHETFSGEKSVRNQSAQWLSKYSKLVEGK